MKKNIDKTVKKWLKQLTLWREKTGQNRDYKVLGFIHFYIFIIYNGIRKNELSA